MAYKRGDKWFGFYRDAAGSQHTKQFTRKRDADLWQRVRKGFAMPDLEDKYVRQQTSYYARHPEYLQRMFDRSFDLTDEPSSNRAARAIAGFCGL